MRKLYLPKCLWLLAFIYSHSIQAQTLVHYWNFNNSTDEASLLTPTFTVGGALLTKINGATSVIQTTSNTAQGFETLNENARNGDPSGTHLRYNNSVDGTLIFTLPTTGYENPIVKYTTRRSSAANGAEKQVIDYSIDGTNYTNLTTITTDFNGPILQTLDFSSISAADNNANFKIKITFLQGVGGITGNNRFDNFTLDGIANVDVTPPSIAFNPVNNAVNIATNIAPTLTFNEDVRLVDNSALTNTNVDEVVELRLSNSTGTPVAFDATINGKVITVTPSTLFQISQTYYLSVKPNTVEDISNNVIATTQSISFTTGGTQVSFDKKVAIVSEDAGSIAIKVKLANPSASTVSLVVKGAPFSTGNTEDFTLITQTLSFTGDSPLEQTITLPIINDNAFEQDEYVVLSLESASGLTITGGNYMTIYIKDNDRLAPQPTKEIELSYVSSFDPGSSTAEIVVHDPASQRMFVISSVQDRLDIADFSNPASITLIKSVDMAPYGGITSVATKNGIVAVASPNVNEQLDGSVVFFNTNGEFQKQVTVGALPDMITFSPDGKKVMTANEGQPNNDYSVDPEGSVSIIDISGGIGALDQSKVTTLLFTSYNTQETVLRAAGVRKLKTSSTLSQDFEPEFITIAADSRKAWVTLQENNAIAEIDLDAKSIGGVWALGKKDLSVMGNGIDASDNSGLITISNWPVKAFYIPDAVANYTVAGVHYLVTANEGDEKEYAGLNERTTVGAVTLDPTVFPHAAVLKETHNLGRLRMSNLSGDTDGDGDYDEINVPGGRSFTIWNTATKTKVFDSGDDFERYTSTAPSIAALFNADNENNTLKGRSRAKGPEPEGLTIASINEKIYAFIALERVGGVMVYDITDPANAKFVDYKNSRSLTSYTGDHGPEGLIYISRENSPNNKAYIAVANEISGTVSVFEITPTPKLDQTITFNTLASKTVGETPFALNATASSTLTVSYTSANDKVTVSGSQVAVVKAGKATITANQPGNASYNAATSVSQTFCVNPAKPVVTLTGEDTEAPVLQSSATEGNQWYKNGALITGATNATLTVSGVGIYTVKAIVETCESTLSSEFPVVITGDIDPLVNDFKISPNPASEVLVIQLPGAGTKSIQIYEVTGAVKEFRISSESKEEFNVRNWANGYYLIRVITAKGNHFGRFIKN